MAAYLLVVIVRRERGRRPGLFETSLVIDPGWMRRLIALGLPAASQITLEVGVFAASTALAGRLVPTALAAHQIAVNIAALSFMVPLGVSSAGAVRVGHALGRRDLDGAARAGWTALAHRRGIHGVHGLAFRPHPENPDGRVHPRRSGDRAWRHAARVAAVFQLFDGIQGVATGILRGLGDTRTPMAWNLVRPLVCRSSEWLCVVLVAGYGVVGLWWGLTIGLTICGVALLVVWSRRIHVFELKATWSG